MIYIEADNGTSHACMIINLSNKFSMRKIRENLLISKDFNRISEGEGR